MISHTRLNRFLVAGWCVVSLILLFFASRADSYDCLIAWHTIALGLLSAMVSIPLGFILAWTCLGTQFVNRLMLLCTVSLLAIPIFLHVSTWDAAFGRLGWIKTAEGETLQPLISGWRAASWIHGVAAAPQVAIILLIGFSLGRQSIEEQALLDMSRLRVFWHIRLRRLWPLIFVSLLWTVVSAAREIAATDLYQIGTLAEQIYLGYSLGQFNAIVGGWSEVELAAAVKLNYGLALVVLCWLAITSAILFFRLIGQERESELGTDDTPFAKRDVLETNTSFRVKTGCALLLLLILFVAPMTNLLIRSCLSISLTDGVPTANYSLAQLGSVLYRSVWNYQREFLWTFLIGLASSSIIMVLAATAVWRARRSSAIQVLLGLSWIISCTVPGPLTGTIIGGIFQITDWALVQYLYNRTILAPAMATVCFCWPFPPLIFWFIFRNTSSEMIDNARLEGAGEWRIFWRFGILDHLPKLFGCWLVTLAICLGDLSASQMVLPPGMDTLPRLMLGLLHAGVDEMTAGITIVLIGLVGLLSLSGWKMIQWSVR